MTDKLRHTRRTNAPRSRSRALAQSGPRSLKVVLSVISILILLFSGLGYALVGGISPGPNPMHDQIDAEPDGATDILLVGSDSRTDAQGNSLSQEELEMLHAGEDTQGDNTDTIMLIRIPNDGTSATAISIPRDTYIHDDDMGNTKINAVAGAHMLTERERLVNEGVTDEKELEERSKNAGRAALSKDVEQLSGVSIDHYAEVGLLGFVLLTNAVGGVEVCLNEDVDEPMSGAKFHKGRQTLDGAQGLSFVRQRHELPRGDLDRIVRQQAYMASLVSKVLSTGTLTNPARINEMSKAVRRSVTLDDNWDPISFALQLQNLTGGNVSFNTIPVTSINGQGDNGESVVTINTKDVHKFFDDLLQDQDPTTDAPKPSESTKESAPDIDLQVLNASGEEGLASSVAGTLAESNFKVTETGNAEDGLYTESQVLTSDAEDSNAHDIAEKLGNLPVTVDETLEPGSVIVILAADYAGPRGDAAAGTEVVEETTVGSPGYDQADAIVSPRIDASGDGPKCVN